MDVLVLNAGVMALPKRELSKDGFEMQMATNCFGHYALLGVCMPLLKAAAKPRVVFVSSGFHHSAGGISFDDLQSEKSYEKWRVYSETKLGDLLLMHKLARLAKEKQVPLVSVACHPGYSATNLQTHTGLLGTFANAVVAQAAWKGAMPTVLAAADEHVESGQYAGPRFYMWGEAQWGASQSKYAGRAELQDKFWAACAQLTGVDVASML